MDLFGEKKSLIFKNKSRPRKIKENPAPGLKGSSFDFCLYRVSKGSLDFLSCSSFSFLPTTTTITTSLCQPTTTTTSRLPGASPQGLSTWWGPMPTYHYHDNQIARCGPSRSVDLAGPYAKLPLPRQPDSRCRPSRSVDLGPDANLPQL